MSERLKIDYRAGHSVKSIHTTYSLSSQAHRNNYLRFKTIRSDCKRLDHDFFNMPTMKLAEADESKLKKESTDYDDYAHGGTIKSDATNCDAEVRYPTDTNIL